YPSLFIIPRPPTSTLFPYTTLFRSLPPVARRPVDDVHLCLLEGRHAHARGSAEKQDRPRGEEAAARARRGGGRHRRRLRRLHVRSEEHTSELQSPCNLVCRLLLEKK